MFKILIWECHYHYKENSLINTHKDHHLIKCLTIFKYPHIECDLCYVNNIQCLHYQYLHMVHHINNLIECHHMLNTLQFKVFLHNDFLLATLEIECQLIMECNHNQSKGFLINLSNHQCNQCSQINSIFHPINYQNLIFINSNNNNSHNNYPISRVQMI